MRLLGGGDCVGQEAESASNRSFAFCAMTGSTLEADCFTQGCFWILQEVRNCFVQVMGVYKLRLPGFPLTNGSEVPDVVLNLQRRDNPRRAVASASCQPWDARRRDSMPAPRTPAAVLSDATSTPAVASATARNPIAC